ncbi:chitosanase [Dolichospermum lemmermannii CS-548]|uniref:chitosanase n=1 Tax=Dolichospermum lemmermannii TaxID=54295 RepID=UPI0023303AC6|nr:chitosanase [Dolichospermum lemmermannii]MDB9436893.1 chitosanase [Dolichospermum lemmermannii CS-548]
MNNRSAEENQIPGIEYFPSGTLSQLETLTGLDAEQITNILGMINGPEQANCKWWLTKNNKIIYSYAEDIRDGRGVTIGLYGATTGQGFRDADVIWNNYGHPEYGGLPQEEIIQKVEEIANDCRWWNAQWDAYISTYWNPTIDWLQSRDYMKALSIGALMDTAMNAGIGDDSPNNWGVEHLFQEAIANTENEQGFLGRFLELRLRYPTKNSGNMRRRVSAWQQLWRENKWDMRVDLSHYCYIPGVAD